MYPIINTQQVENLARPCYADAETIEKAIEEATLLDIMPALGVATFEVVKSLEAEDALFTGASYVECGEEKVSVGLAKTLAYFTWARLVKTSPLRLTRYGFVEKRAENSAPVSWDERQAAYNDAFAIAQTFLGGVLGYIRSKKSQFPDFEKCREAHNNSRLRITAIGE